MFKNPLSIGIDISDYRLRIVELRKKFRRLELASFDEVVLEPGVLVNGIIQKPEMLVKALKTLGRHLKGSHIKLVRAGLPEQQSFITSTRIGTLAKDEVIREAVKNIPFEKDQMYYDVSIQKIHKVASIAAGRKEFIDTFISTLEQADYHLVGLYVEADAIAQALFSGQGNHTGKLVIDIGLARTTVIFYMHSSVFFTTSYPSVINDGIINQQNLASVLQQILIFYNEHYLAEATLEKIVLCGSGAYIDNTATYINQLTTIPTELGNPFSGLRLNHVSKKMQKPLTYATAIGLALEQ